MARMSVEALQLQEIKRKDSGYHIVGIPRQAVASAVAVVPGEFFADVSMTIYQDPDFVACFGDLMQCTTVREKAVCLGEYLKVYPDNTDIVDRAALEALPLLGVQTAKQFLKELSSVAPDRNWAECMSYMRDSLVG